MSCRSDDWGWLGTLHLVPDILDCLPLIDLWRIVEPHGLLGTAPVSQRWRGLPHFHHILNLSKRRNGFLTRTPVHYVVQRRDIVNVRWDMDRANHLQKLFIRDFLICVGVYSSYDSYDLLVRREMTV